MKTITILLFFICVIPNFQSQDVYIPDNNFKSCLLNNPQINTNGDSEIQISEASAFTGTITCVLMNIYDLTGIEAFTELTGLEISDNYLSSLDISNNTKLTLLTCPFNQLTSLDVSNNLELTSLGCGYNQLTNIDVSNNLLLFGLSVSGNQLTSLDISNNLELVGLTLWQNQITSLDVSNNINLETLSCYENPITSLDLSNNVALMFFLCYSSQLSELNIQNENNTNIMLFKTYDNPNLECIQVDDSEYSSINWTNIDPHTSFSENCEYASIADFGETNVTIYPNPVNAVLNIESGNLFSAYRLYNSYGQLVKYDSIDDNTQKVLLDDIDDGIYYLVLKGDRNNNYVHKKIIIAKH